MDVVLNNSSGVPLYEQIVQQIKQLVQTEQLPEGTPLPSMRQLAKDLRISVITTKRAYEELEQAGYLISQAGRGSFAANPGRAAIRQEQDTRLDEHLQAAVTIAKQAGIPREELIERLCQCYKEEQ